MNLSVSSICNTIISPGDKLFVPCPKEVKEELKASKNIKESLLINSVEVVIKFMVKYFIV
jgi:hypothetical protein